MLGYQYALSKRTNLWLNYSKITNEVACGYDFGANAGYRLDRLGALSAGRYWR